MLPKKIIAALMFSAFFATVASAQSVSDRIKINQVGYYPNAPKLAVVTGDAAPSEFYITSTNLLDTIFTGRLSEQVRSGNSSTKTRVADFTPVNRPGSYVLLVPSIGHSYVFEVNKAVHRKTGISVLKGFYYQRMSMPLEEQYAGKWHRSTGHPDNKVLVHQSAASPQRTAGTVISSPGGWYDAGDYNKYVVNSGITMGTMLAGFEDFGDYYSALDVNIPESNNGVADVVDEVVYNLRWMLTMQDPFDGGVYHKCTNAAFDGMVMPGVTKDPRYVVAKGTAATLDFAAVTAQSARILKRFQKQYPGLADSCLKAAEKAWQWAKQNPAILYDQNKINEATEPDISTGAYGDRNLNDEWIWAASELFVTTKVKSYFEVVEKQVTDSITLPSWGSVAALGYYTMLRHKSAMPGYAREILVKLTQGIITLADRYISNVPGNAFKTVMGQSRRDFNWGSNSNAANQGILLANAYLLTKDKKYIDHALTNVDYILGRNATGYSFVTGIGSKSTMRPHHRPSTADGIIEPVPGLLAGGPNPAMQDKCKYEFTEPETAYTDDDCSYASNEIAINWNAPIVYLANAIEALQYVVGYSKK